MRRFFVTAVAVFGLSGPAQAAPRVVATFLPVHGIVAAVMEGIGEPALLIDTAASPHTYALTPSKRRLLEDADLVIGIGPDMEAGIWEAVKGLPGDALALMPMAGDRAIGPGERGGEADRDNQPDPHIWLDTGLAVEMAYAVATELARHDPPNADRYRANADAFGAEIYSVDNEIAAELAGHGPGAAISYHDAFSYFARQWDIDYGYVVLEPDLTPSAARVSEIRERAASGGIACLMTEPQFRPDLLAALAADYGLPVVEIDPVGTAIAPGPQYYAQLMRLVGAAFAGCLGR